ncbi:MAG: hypothetical protein U0414_03885 [Polyangiaceae bacterium]
MYLTQLSLLALILFGGLAVVMLAGTRLGVPGSLVGLGCGVALLPVLALLLTSTGAYWTVGFGSRPCEADSVDLRAPSAPMPLDSAAPPPGETLDPPPDRPPWTRALVLDGGEGR